MVAEQKAAELAHQRLVRRLLAPSLILVVPGLTALVTFHSTTTGGQWLVAPRAAVSEPVIVEPTPWTPVCRDGWHSPSIGKSGACSHHGGVAPGKAELSWHIVRPAAIGVRAPVSTDWGGMTGRALACLTIGGGLAWWIWRSVTSFRKT